MTEHEKLKAICDKIGYKSEYEFDRGFFIDNISGNWIGINVKEIIFTQDFINKFEAKLMEKGFEKVKKFRDRILKHLDNPVQYLYNLLN